MLVLRIAPMETCHTTGLQPNRTNAIIAARGFKGFEGRGVPDLKKHCDVFGLLREGLRPRCRQSQSSILTSTVLFVLSSLHAFRHEPHRTRTAAAKTVSL